MNFTKAEIANIAVLDKFSKEKLFTNSPISKRMYLILRRRMQGLTLQKIAEETGVTRERVRQQESKGLLIVRSLRRTRSECCNTEMVDGGIQCENCGSDGKIKK